MSNPYQASGSQAALSDKPGTKSWSIRHWLTAVACVLAVIVLSIIALVLITQAVRLGSEQAGLPSRFQNAGSAIVRSSWIGGGTALVLVVLNAAALVFIRNKNLVVPITILALTAIGMVGVAVLFKPG